MAVRKFQFGDTVQYQHDGVRYIRGIVMSYYTAHNFYNMLHFLHQKPAHREKGWCPCAGVEAYMVSARIVLTEKVVFDKHEI